MANKYFTIRLPVRRTALGSNIVPGKGHRDGGGKEPTQGAEIHRPTTAAPGVRLFISVHPFVGNGKGSPVEREDVRRKDNKIETVFGTIWILAKNS